MHLAPSDHGFSGHHFSLHLVAGVGALALAISAICSAAPAQAAPDSGGVTAPPPVSDTFPARGPQDVALITGDVVHLDSAGKVAGVDAGARPDGSAPHFSTYTAGSHTYVIPSDMRSLIGSKLDRGLFDVTALASSTDTDADTTLPVIVTPPDGSSRPVDASTMGVHVARTFKTMAAQAGKVNAKATSRPAPSWSLLKALKTTSAKVWLDRGVQLDDPQPSSGTSDDSAVPAWMSLIGVDKAHTSGWTGAGVKLGLVDSGVDEKHPDLAGQVVASKDFTGSGSADDAIGHGTFIASELVGTGAASNGKYEGVAPDATLVNARVLDEDGYGSDSTLMAGIDWAAQQGAQVINLSFGDPFYYDDGTSLLSLFVDHVAEKYGCLIVVAAGNDGGPQTISAPATADEALSVGATFSDGTLAWFSSQGPRRGDGAVNPQIMAPGAGQLDPNTGYPAGMVGAKPGTSGYTSPDDGIAGTSMAAPLVAGAAALLKQADPSLDRNGLRAKLMASATPLPDDSSVFAQGAGLVNIPAAIAQQVTTNPTQLDFGAIPAPYPDSVTQTLTYSNQGATDETFTLQGGLTFTKRAGGPVTWDEYYGVATNTSGAAKATPSDDTPDTSEASPAPLSPDHISLSADTLTVPAGGTASVDVTIDPQAFARGDIGGYVTATSADGLTIRTPIGLENQPAMYQVTIDATDKDGDAIDTAMDLFSYADMMAINLETGDFQYIAISQGTATAQLEESSYVFIGDSVKAQNGGVVETVLLSPQIDVNAPTKVVLDGTATVPITTTTDQPAYGSIVAQSTFSTPDTFFMDEFTWSNDQLGTYTLYVTPLPGGNDGSWTLDAAATLTQPYLEASLDACGETPVTIAEATDLLSVGTSSLTVVDGFDAEAPDDHSAALVHWEIPDPSSLDSSVVSEWVKAASKQGYSAVIIDSDAPFLAEAAAQFAYMMDLAFDSAWGTIPILVTGDTVGDQLRLLADGGDPTLYLLRRETPDYVYGLAAHFDQASPAQYALTGDSSTMATVTVTHRSMGSMTYSQDALMTDLGVGNDGFDAVIPSSYTAYLTGGQSWQLGATMAESRGTSPMTSVVTPLKKYAAGGVSTVAFGSQAHTAGTGSAVGFGIVRFADELVGGVPWFVDGWGNTEVFRNWDIDPNYGVVKFTLTDVTTGTQLYATDDNNSDSWVAFDVPGLDPAAHTYRLDETTTSQTDAWVLSTQVTSSWTWRSQTTPQTGDTLVNEPLRDIWYELPGLDAYNNGNESQTIVLHVGQQVDSVPLTATTVSLKATTDGTTWADVPVHLGSVASEEGAISGEALYEGVIDAPVGAIVSLKASVTGGDSSVSQTITDAYKVTESPANIPEPTTWATDCSVTNPTNSTPPPPSESIPRVEPNTPSGSAPAAGSTSPAQSKPPVKIGTGGTVIPAWSPSAILDSIHRWLTASG